MGPINISQNFPKDSEDALNQLVNNGLNAGLNLKSMIYYFERQEIGLNGFSCFINRKRKTGINLIKKILNYMNMRGGKVVFNNIQKPVRDEWGTGIETLQVCLELFKKLYETVNQVDQTATTNNDLHLSSFLEKEIMGTILVNIRLVASIITDLQRVSPTGMGEYEVNKDLQRRYGVFSVKNYSLTELFLLQDYEGHFQAGGHNVERMEVMTHLVASISKLVSTGSVQSIRDIVQKLC